ncbi:MAG: response regulator transcription factor [Betaproteobacteria bacterium]|nr:response regulator transcription factor [Betaproteobacteria bacterium]
MTHAQRCTLIVEHSAESRTAMARLLSQVLPDLPVCEASTRAQAEKLIRTRTVELALIDFGLPDGSGLDVLRTLHLAQPQARAVVVTMFDDDAHLFPALQAGAFGYVLKDRPEIELVAQLRRIQEGEPPLSSTVARRMLQHFAAIRGQATAPGAQASGDVKWGRRVTDVGGAPPADTQDLARYLSPQSHARPGMAEEPEVVLTDRETEVLQRVGKGYTLPEIAQQLGLSRHTVADYVKQIYRKLDISSRAEAALEAARRGLVR